jgi:predicted acylesterase/phospholipase RssA/CRP-like cAMP-binding protein
VSADEPLNALPLFEGLSGETLSHLNRQTAPISFHVNETLFRSGARADYFYILESGSVNVEMDWQGEPIRLHTARATEVIGVFPIIGTSERSTTAIPSENGGAYRIAADALLDVREIHAQDFETIQDRIRILLLNVQLKLALRLSALFQGLEDVILSDLEKKLSLVFLPGNTVLCRQGSLAEEIYIVVGGRLQITRQEASGTILLGEVGCGETVGEIGVISRDPRSADVRAIRDSTVAVLSSGSFEELLETYPLQINRTFVRSIIGHLTGREKRVVSSAKTFAVIGLGKDVSAGAISSKLSEAFNKFGSTLVIDSGMCDAALGAEGFSQTSFDSPSNSPLLQWCAQQEMGHRFVIYIADRENTQWTHRCLRQADHVIFVASGEGRPEIGCRERRMLEDPSVENSKRTLVLLHQKHTSVPAGTIEWIRQSKISMQHHARIDRNEDFERIARFLMGSAVGLVLGGGGARGFAHIGVIRALNELGIPIDIVGGNSMGAVIGAQHALGWPPEEMIARTIEFCLRGEELTLPLISVFKGRRMFQGFNRMYGDAHIEDLWKKFFSVSCNLSRARIMTHDTGPVSAAVLNSNSPPGLIPPQVVDGDLLVDGALLNNIPVDVMRRFNPAGPVIAVDVSAREDLLDNTSLSGGVSGVRLLFHRLNPMKTKRIQFPGIREILSRASTIGGVAAQKRMMEGIADLYMTPPVSKYPNMAYKQGKVISEFGYEYAIQQLTEWKLQKTG